MVFSKYVCQVTPHSQVVSNQKQILWSQDEEEVDEGQAWQIPLAPIQWKEEVGQELLLQMMDAPIDWNLEVVVV